MNAQHGSNKRVEVRPAPSHGLKAMQRYVTIDQQATRGEYLFALPARLGMEQLLHDPRDAPALHLICNVLLLTVPSALACLTLCCSHWIGLLYLVSNYVVFLQRFMLTLHVTQHRRLFKAEYQSLNHLTPYLLSPLFGVPPGLYRPHHIIMHHVEDNVGGMDQSSTEPYQRDNLIQFLWYWVTYWVGAWFSLPAYAAAKRRDLLGPTLKSEAAAWLVVTLATWFNPVGALWVLIVPFMLSSFLLMFGNWSQHAFVDPYQPHDTYKSTYNCIGCPDNRLTYNDGYHILHHLNSRLHWSQMPEQFLATLPEHDAHDALVFHSIGFFDVGVAVFTGRLSFLARHVIPCGPLQAQRTQEQWVELLRLRLSPIHRPGFEKKAP